MKRITALWIGVFSLAFMVLGVAAPVAAWDGTLNDSQEPGSVLVFYRFDAGAILTPDEGTIARTQFKISVTCPTDLGPNGCFETGDFATGQAVFLKAHWVCPPNDSGTTCQETDFPLSTTVFGTVEFDANGGEGLPAPPCRNGYLIVWVENQFGERISFNGLIGSAVLRGSATSWRAYNALPIQSPQPSFAELTYVADGGGTALAFDGTEYQAITGTIYGVVAYPNSERTRLTLLTLDVLSNQPNDATNVGLKFYNESEFFISTSASFTCWGEFPLDRLAGGALTGGDFSQQDGLVRSTGAIKGGNPVTVVGIVETEEPLTLGINPGSCQQAAATCTVASNVVAGFCTAACANPLCAVIPAICTRCEAACANANATACTPVNGACQVVGATTSVPLLREYAYPLLNDSIPVPTAFVPFP